MMKTNRLFRSLTALLLWCSVFLLTAGSPAFAQWQLVDTGAVQNGVAFAKGNPTVAWSVGNSGFIRRSLDGGATWASQPSGTANALNAVSDIDASTVWVVGQAGTILKTTNSGVVWTAQTSGVGTQLNGVYAVDANTVWAVGNAGVIRKTVNGGTNWTGQTSGTAQPLNSVSAVNASTAWAVGANGVILKTINGTSWTAQTSGTTASLFSVAAVDANTAWAVGDSGTILKTTNGGATWVPQTSGTLSTLFSIAAVDANILWSAGDSGTILKSTNGGGTWITTTSGTPRQLFSVSAVDDLTSLSVGFFGTYRLTSDGGTTYIGQITGTSQPLHGITSANEQLLWTVGFSGTARPTTTGGNLWTVQNSNTDRNLFAVTETGLSTLWAAGFNGTIIHTTDGGTNWALQPSSTTVQLNGVAAANTNVAWAVGETGVIINTTNTGTSWAPQTSGTTNNLNAVVAVSATAAWAVGDGGVILNWNGTAWSPQTSGTTNNLNGITAVNASKLWAVGNGGVLLVTNNGGTTWSPVSSGTTQALNAVSAFDATNAWAVGNNGAITRTTDGNAWFVEASPTINSWFAVRAVGVGKAFAAGNNGSVIRSFTPINPPVVVTRPATNIGGTFATLNASITPNGSPTTAFIEYGLGASGPYTDSAPLTLTPNDGPVGQTVSIAVTGLAARSTYHYRASATNIAGTTTGIDVVFSTVNSVPVTTLSTASTNEDTALPLTLTATDADGDTVTYNITATPNPVAGTLSSISGGNLVTFTPALNYNGPATFKYTASDAFGGVSPEQTVTITVNAVNDAPDITEDSTHLDGDVGTLFTNSGTWGDVDGDVVTLTASVGVVVKNGNGTWSWSYTPSASGANVPVTITARDPSLASNFVTFTYSSSQPASIDVSMGVNPVANNAGGAPVTLLTTTVGNSRVTYFTVSNTGAGTLSISSIGIVGSLAISVTDSVGATLNYPFTVAAGGTGTFGLLFAPLDIALQSAQVTILSNAVGAQSTYVFNVTAQANRAPIAVDDSLVLSALVATEATDLLTNDSDPDGNALHIDAYSQGGSGTVSVAINGNLVYTPGPTYLGYDEFTYTVADSEGATASATVTVTGAVIPPPVGPGNYATLLRDTGGQVKGMLFYKFNSTGGASGQLRVGQIVRRFAGPAVGGVGTFNANARNLPSMLISVTRGTNSLGFDALLFSIDAGVLTGDSTKSPYSKTVHPPRFGRYTLLAANETANPAVAECLSIRVSADGLVSWGGKNGAGYPVSGSSVLLTAGVTPFYQARVGSGASVQYSNLIITSPLIYGSIHWKFTGTDSRIPSGIDTDYPVYGEAYTAPTTPSGVFGTSSVLVTLNVPTFDTDNLPTTSNPFTKVMSVGTVPILDNAPITKLRFDLVRGGYTGKISVKGHAPRPFFGILLPEAGYGRGVMMDSTLGTSRIEPATPR